MIKKKPKKKDEENWSEEDETNIIEEAPAKTIKSKEVVVE